MEKEYIRISKPLPLPGHIDLLKDLDDTFWKDWIFFHLLTFYEKFDTVNLGKQLENEKSKGHSKIENLITKFIRTSLNNDMEFSIHFKAFGENINDEEIEGFYDITIHNTYWKNGGLHIECKNLDESQDLVNKYVYYNKGNSIYDGGVYRFFNGKYAQKQNFGGMIGFVISGDTNNIKSKIHKKLEDKFDTDPNGNLVKISDSSIKGNDFTFDSCHVRSDENFTIHHLLFNFNS